jgi:hypothetical protein
MYQKYLLLIFKYFRSINKNIHKKLIDFVIKFYSDDSSDRLCGLVVRVLGYRSGGPGSTLGTTRKKNVVGLERGPLCLVSTPDELLNRKVATSV